MLVRRPTLAAVALLGGLATIVRAAPPAANGLPLAADAHGLLSVDRAATDDPGEVGVRFELGYRNEPLRLANPSRDPIEVQHDADLRMGVHFGVLPRLQVGAWVPVGYQVYRDLNGGLADTATVGDLRLYLKVEMVRAPHVGLAAVLAVAAPTGGALDGHASDDAWSGEPRLVLDLHFRWVAILFNAGARLHDDVKARGLSIGPELTWGAAARFQAHRRVALAVELVGSESLDPAGGDAERTAAVLASLFGNVGRGVTLFVGGGRSIASDAARTDAFRLSIGLTWMPPPPEPVVVAAPPPPAPPRPVDGDADHDGIPDSRDRCPYQAEDFDGFEDSDGCPDEDNDGDGIADAQDKCPNEPETKNGIDDDDGCPDNVTVYAPAPATTPLAMPAPIRFRAGDATLPPQPELDRFASSLGYHSEVKMLRIEGHADAHEVGKRAQQPLSQRRAEAVRDYLVEKGVDPKRLQAVGYGAAFPAGSDPLANRRVEIIQIDQ